MKLGLHCKKEISSYCANCVEYTNRDGVRFKLDGCDGMTYYYHPKTGHLHRLDGPASYRRNLQTNEHRWFIDGLEYTEAHYKLACEALNKPPS